MKPYVVPREMTQPDIDHLVAAYATGAANAVRAGFDGVEIHGANGYVIDQFLQSATNRRTDDYGGSIVNRCRILHQIIASVSREISADRIGLRISPTSRRKGMGDEDPGALAAAIGSIAQDAGLAYIHLIEPIASGFMEQPEHPVMTRLRAGYSGAIIQNGSFDAQTAADFIAGNQADAISFGRPYIANPDLVERMQRGLPLAEANFDFAYVGDRRGYSDYPRHS
jgi:N-ethylmaleimide reductase